MAYKQFDFIVKRCRDIITIETMNERIKNIQAETIRDPINIFAEELEEQMYQGEVKPFKSVLKANIGDCHAMGQKPITFIRQVLALVSYTDLFDDPSIPSDAKESARRILKGCRGGSVGAYTDSPGIESIREHVAEYIKERDGGIPSYPEDIILSNGASESIKSILRLLICNIDGKLPGVMVPIPQYPLYSAALAEFNMYQIDYYLNESRAWGLEVDELNRAVNEAKLNCKPRAIVVINPGNPTGQVLTRDNIVDVIKFAYQEKLLILADEVYQHNIYAAGSKFHSFKKVLKEMGEPYSNMELASFMSVSKGYMGECGIRGGYVEIINLDPKVKAQLLKCISASLCPTVYGQTVMDCIMCPPKKGDPSFERHEEEKHVVLDSLKERARMVYEAFNSIPGFKCNPVQGAMYAFPRIELPEKAIEVARSKNQAPDAFYAFQLLESTGICVVPGSGFGQIPGTYHFRTTILPQTEKLKEMLDNFKEFHLKFLEQYC